MNSYVNVNLPYNLSVPIPLTPIGVNLSGGADSSLLLYILMSNVKQKIHIFTYASNDKGRVTALTSANVIEQCIQLTNNNNVEHHISYYEQLDNSAFLSLPTRFKQTNEISDIYTAVTANPPSSVTSKFRNDTTLADDRNPDVIRPTSNFEDNWHTPFTNIDKRTIARLYLHFNLLGKLFPLTRSCEAEGRGLFSGHCGQCWWCQEREWAFCKV